MTSLYPGLLFYSTGLNKKSTPLPPETTPSEIETKLGRVPFNGKPWPKSSPVSAVYDVRNTSTRMIILNNKLSKKTKASHLRGQTEKKGEILAPEPSRHVKDESKTNWEHHKHCKLSVSEKFVPIFPHGTSPAPEWVNKTQRPAMRFDNGSSVNPNHHIQCQGTTEYMQLLQWYDAQRKRPRERTPSVRESRTMSPILHDRHLSKGEKRYLTHIARIYSVSDMRQLKQNQYNKLMWQEISKGTYKESDWSRYNRYLNTPRKTQFGPCNSFSKNKRSISAPGHRKPSPEREREEKEDDDSRPQTTPNRFLKSSGKGGARPVERRAGTDKSTKGRPRKGAPCGKKSDSLVGKPARVESPLPPVQKTDSKQSLSSLEDEEEPSKGDNQRAVDESPKREEKKDKEEGKREAVVSKKVEEEEEDENSRANNAGQIGVLEINDDEYKENEDEDERSKMSARDTDEQRGQAIEYHPTISERVELDEERSSDADKPQYKTSVSERKDEKDEKGSNASNTGSGFQSREPSPQQKPEPKFTGQSNTERPGIIVTEDGEQKRMSSDDYYQRSSEEDAADENRDDGFAGSPELIHHIHKEGKDRPMSRIGGREQFMVITKKDRGEI